MAIAASSIGVSRAGNRSSPLRLALVIVVAVLFASSQRPTPAAADKALEWTYPTLVGHNSLLAVSCGSTSFCVATENYTAGEATGAVMSTDPASADPAWTETRIEAEHATQAISCVEEAICVAGNSASDILTLSDPVGPFPTSATTSIDAGPIAGVSCTSETFCIAVSVVGVMATAKDPASPDASWTTSTPAGQNGFNAISCVASELCVAGAFLDVSEPEGELLISTNPAAPTPTWSELRTGVGMFPQTISCPSASLCVAGAGEGYVLASTNPKAPLSRWTSTYVDSNIITSVSCVSSSFCVAVDNKGEVLESSDPGAASPTWSVADLDGDVYLSGVSCASESLCVVVDDDGNVIVGKITHTVSVSLIGRGAGSVSGPGMSCPATCSNTYAAGGSTVLTATPSAGSTFAGWGGACSGDGTCQVSVSADESVSADFTPSEPAPQPESQPQPEALPQSKAQTGSTTETQADTSMTSTVAAGGARSPGTPAVIAKFAPIFKTRAALRGSTVGLLVGFPAITGAAHGATVRVRCRAACSYGLSVVRHPTTRGTVAVTLERPLVLRRATIVEIAVTKPGYLGRYVEYRFRRRTGAAQPYAISHGCLTTTRIHRACN